jgi:hypothetical protein
MRNFLKSFFWFQDHVTIRCSLTSRPPPFCSSTFLLLLLTIVLVLSVRTLITPSVFNEVYLLHIMILIYPADVAVAEPLSQTSPALRFNSSALLPGSQPSIHSIRPITIPHLSAQREVAHVAGGDLSAGGAVNQDLIVAVADGWRFFSHGTRWHPWGYCGVCENESWGLEVPPRTPDEVASGQETDVAEKV